MGQAARHGRTVTRAILIIAVLASIGGAYAFGRHDGARLNKAARDAAILIEVTARDQLAARLAAAEAARLRDANRVRLLTQALEDQAYADPVSVPQCLSADRLRRLNRR